MKRALQIIAAAALGTIILCGIFAGTIAPYGYDMQDRESISALPSHDHPLGSDDLGRDRFSRLLYALRVTLALAPAAALISTLLAAIFGGIAGFYGGVVDSAVGWVIDLFLALPWIFLLLLIRAVMPLNTDPIRSVTITFATLGLLGWAASARIVRNGVRKLAKSDFVLQAIASGCPKWRLLVRHVVPNLKSILAAQFWIALPVFVLTEANLSMLGLGVAEPLPSLGGMIRELQTYSGEVPKLWLFAPLVLLIALVGSLNVLASGEEWSL